MFTIIIIIMTTVIEILKILSPIATYVIYGISLMKLSNLENAKFSWFAWIPIANKYLLGKVADKIEQKKGKKRYYRIVLLATNVSFIAIILLSFVVIFGGIINAIISIYTIITTGTFSLGSITSLLSPVVAIIKQLIAGTLTLSGIPGIILPNLWLLLPISIVLLAIRVANIITIYISSFEVFKKYDFKYRILYLIASIGLSIVFDFDFVLPLCLLISVKRFQKRIDNSVNVNNTSKPENNTPQIENNTPHVENNTPETENNTPETENNT